MKQKMITFGGPVRRAPANREQAASAVNKRRKRRRTGRHTLHYLLILLVAVAIMGVLSLTVFFRIESIDVEGTTRYAASELIDTGGVKVGDNLFRVSERAVSKRLSEKYAYIESVTLKRRFPPRLTLEVKEEQPLGAADTGAGFIVIGRSGRILESGISPPQGVTVVTGMYLSAGDVGRRMGAEILEGDIAFPKDVEPVATADSKGKPRPASEIAAEDKKKRQNAAAAELDGFNMLYALVDAIEETAFSRITLVDFSDQLNMMVVYDDRLIVELGSQADLAYKLKFVKSVIANNLDADFEGILDASSAATSKELRSIPCVVQDELVRRGLVPTPDQETAGGQPSEDSAGGTRTAGEEPEAETSSGTAVPGESSSGTEADGSHSAPVSDEYAVIPDSAPVSSSSAP